MPRLRKQRSRTSVRSSSSSIPSPSSAPTRKWKWSSSLILQALNCCHRSGELHDENETTDANRIYMNHFVSSAHTVTVTESMIAEATQRAVSELADNRPRGSRLRLANPDPAGSSQASASGSSSSTLALPLTVRPGTGTGTRTGPRPLGQTVCPGPGSSPDTGGGIDGSARSRGQRSKLLLPYTPINSCPYGT
ncbi:uncharacterized protein DSM5745_00117 [Aspergillus mulundensis]|uniref:Uncharacterized protein n=1 Tax=Aspergillus mulundensis TaxID=1810919 RepID=A0A3D8T2K2_9EURO|nr:hypothetical protein DSM5745_00117 [Aspergillus mulundensis]RDW92795.1 hypothetical protein DSM5745_00117 [Aspergillus mulundensis]